MSTSAKKLFKNIFANQAGFLVSVVVTFFLSPFVVNSLGSTRYGIWSLIVSLTGNYGLLAFGIQGAMTRYIAHAAATDDRERVNGYFNTALTFLLCSAGLTLVIGFGVAVFIDYLFVLPKDLISQAKSACVLVTLSAAATFLFAAFDSVLVANQRFQLTNAVGTVTTLVRAGMTVWLLKNGYGIVALAALGTGLTLFNGVMVAMVVKRLFPWIKLSFILASRSSFKELMDYGYKSFTVALAVALVYQCDVLVIASFLPPDKITIYSLASTIVTYLIQLITTIYSALGPYVTELYAKDKELELKEFVVEGSCLMYMFGALLLSGCLVFGEAFFNLWVGKEYTESGYILSLLIIPQFFSSGARVGGALLVGMAKIGPLAVAAICQGVCNLLLSLLLVRYFGITGVAIGTLIPLVIMDALWVPSYVAKTIGLRMNYIYKKAMLPGSAVGVMLYLIGYLMVTIYNPSDWYVFIMEVVISIFMFILIATITYEFLYGRKIFTKHMLNII